MSVRDRIFHASLEIFEGKIDVVIYPDEHETRFYYYRFWSEDVLGIPLPRTVSIVSEREMRSFLKEHGKDYDVLLQELLQTARENNMTKLYDM